MGLYLYLRKIFTFIKNLKPFNFTYYAGKTIQINGE